MSRKVLIESQYLPNITYFRQLLTSNLVTIDQYEHYQKGTYRNRCHICNANGLLRLSVPLKRGKNQRTAMKDVRISYDHDWQKIHWQSFTSGYRRSPYFEFFEDDFIRFYEKKYNFLLDLNLDIFRWVANQFQLDIKTELSSEYVADPSDVIDLRSAIHSNSAKNKVAVYAPKYMQVYEGKLEFLPNLSAIDLLFNLGPKGAALLKE